MKVSIVNHALLTLLLGQLLSSTSYGQSQQNASSTSVAEKNKISSMTLAETPAGLSFSSGDFYNQYESLLNPRKGLEFSLSLSQTKFELTSTTYDSSSKVEVNLSLASISAAYAFSPAFYFGVLATAGTSDTESSFKNSTYSINDKDTSKASGSTEPQLSIGTHFDYGSLLSNLSLSYSPKMGDATYKNLDNRTSEGNLKTGGSSVTPSFSLYTKPNNKLIIGTKLSYSILQERTSEFTSSTGKKSYSTRTNGNIQHASVFAEIEQAQLTMGGKIDYVKHEANTNEGQNDKFENSATAMTSVSGYFKVSLDKTISLIPSLTLGEIGEGGGNLDRKQMYSASLTGKLNF